MVLVWDPSPCNLGRAAQAKSDRKSPHSTHTFVVSAGATSSPHPPRCQALPRALAPPQALHADACAAIFRRNCFPRFPGPPVPAHSCVADGKPLCARQVGCCAQSSPWLSWGQGRTRRESASRGCWNGRLSPGGLHHNPSNQRPQHHCAVVAGQAATGRAVTHEVSDAAGVRL